MKTYNSNEYLLVITLECGPDYGMENRIIDKLDAEVFNELNKIIGDGVNEIDKIDENIIMSVLQKRQKR